MTDGSEASRGGDRPDGITPSQTVGPFFHYALTPHAYHLRELFSAEIVTPDAVGERIRLEGYVMDGDGELIVDAALEIWQADGEGRYATASSTSGANAQFNGFGRTDLDSNGFFKFETVKPASVPGPNGTMQAPHINVTVFARGLLRHLFTRIYFADEAANGSDPILQLVPAERRSTLIATRRDRGAEPPAYTFNIRLQGEDETVFFDG